MHASKSEIGAAKTAMVALKAFLLLLCACIGAIGGCFVYMFVSLHLESTIVPYFHDPTAPTLSNGQFFGFVMMPIAMLLGSVVGASLLALFVKWTRAAVSLQLIGGLLVSVFVAFTWLQSVENNGLYASDLAVFMPIAVFSLALTVTGAIGWQKLRSK